MVSHQDWASKDDAELMSVLAAEAGPGEAEQHAEAKQHACAVLAARYYAVMLERARGELPPPLADLAEDVVQEVIALLLLRAKAETFDRSRPLGPWLLQVVTYKARDVHRHERRHRAAGDLQRPIAGREAVPPERVLKEDYLAALLGRLTAAEQEITRLFYLDGLSARAIAGRLAWPLEKVYRELHKVRTKLRASPGP